MTSNAASSGLVSIPAELLLQVTSYLTTPELGNVRLVCKSIEASLLASFTREFFAKRQFMITEFSLQALVNISKSRFSAALKHVIFGIERPTFENGLRHHRHMGASSRGDRDQANRRLEGYVSHSTFMNTCQDFEMLAEAFSNLVNLEIIGLRDFCSNSRTRDWPNISWRSYGTSTFVSEYGLSLIESSRGIHFASPPPLLEHEHMSRMFLNLLRALGKTNSRAKEFQVILRRTRLHDDAFYIPPYADQLVKPALANLSTLFLDLESTSGPFLDLDNQDSECSTYYFRKFLAKVPNLEHLRLNFRQVAVNKANELMTWLAKPKLPAVAPSTIPKSSGLEAPSPVELTLLRQLDIGMVTVSPKTLLALLEKFQNTLLTISLHKVVLLDHDPEKLTDKVNLWARVFGRISKLNLKLTAMNLSLLSQELTTRKVPQHLAFNNSKDRKVRKWSGVDVQSGLRDIQADMAIDWAGYDTEGLKSDEDSPEESDVSMDDDDYDHDGDEDAEDS